jgi:hypothetical protein
LGQVRRDGVQAPEHKPVTRVLPPPPPSIIPLEVAVEQDMINRFYYDNSNRHWR